MEDPLIEGGRIRKLWIGETDQYLAHLLRLDEDSRRNRFGGVVPDEVVRAGVEAIDPLTTILHGFFVDGMLRGVADVRLIGGALPQAAEAAFSVEMPWQSHGVGSALLEHCLLTARNRGVKQLHMMCLAHNRRMQQLAKKFDAELSVDFGSVVGELETPFPTPLSMFRELVADGHNLANAMLDAQMRLLR